jgi:hypothetical protein
MLDFVTTKPKWWWLMMFSCLTAITVGSIGVLLVIALGNKFLHLSVFSLILILWLTAAISCFMYMGRQFSGTYKNIEPRRLSKQVW